MTQHCFSYHSIDELILEGKEQGVTIPFSASVNSLSEPLVFGYFSLPNRIGTAPMEGSDAKLDGSPSELTIRKYLRFARGGSAIIWFEAVSVVSEGRASQNQLFLHRNNVDAFKSLVNSIKETGLKTNGFEPFVVMQATHSGRYSNPENCPLPMIACRNPYLEKKLNVDDNCIVSDDYLKGLEEKFGESTAMAKEVGFDAVDIKACHGYLLAELMSAFRRKGLYGGDFENRTRLLKNCIDAANAYKDNKFLVTSRIGIYDGFPYPFGFGNDDEPERLVADLYDKLKVPMVCLTVGNPYVVPHITRPYVHGSYESPEHPLTGIERIIRLVAKVKRAVPEMKVLASAPSYLRQFAPNYASGAIDRNMCDGMLFGRMALANPNFANDILHGGKLERDGVCVTCGRCAQLLRSHLSSGCVIRDKEIYGPIYRQMASQK